MPAKPTTPCQFAARFVAAWLLAVPAHAFSLFGDGGDATTSPSASGSASVSSAWLDQRKASHEQWKTAHPNAQAGLADLAARTEAVKTKARAEAEAAKVAADAAARQPKPDKYAELRQRSQGLTPEQRAEARNKFKVAFELWQAGDFEAAVIGFRRGLEIDPANGIGNYYYADCLKRKGDRAGAHEYMSRAAKLMPDTAEGMKAEAALPGLKPVATQAEPALPPPVVWRVSDTPYELWDCPECPEMVVIPAGEFNMGSPASESGRYDHEGPVHRVAVPSFALAKTEVTQGQWKALMGSNPSKFSDCGDDCPVEQVTWDEAQAYVRKLSEKTGHKYRLPTEAEWEYAARAGTTTAYWWGDQASHEYMNYGKDECCDGLASGRDQWVKTAPVARFPANPFGLYDMNGNVSEWLEDCWHDSYTGAPTDGGAWAGGDCGKRLLRGGAWFDFPRFLRAAVRDGNSPANRVDGLGFRPARIVLP